MSRFYLAGKMTGEPEHGFPPFNAAAARLRAMGHSVFNPAENVGDGDGATAEGEQGRAHFMRMDILAIVGGDCDICNVHFPKVDAVVVLPNWHRSRGARLEVEIAQQLDIPVLWADTLEPLTLYDLHVARYTWNDEYLLPNYAGVSA